mmetsp:Transcript_664/g.2220  ORF Transcript_664/g.2220 Transcript_664/m.2220 type:complete len:410 (+) Transcript_664:199-1428(+)
MLRSRSVKFQKGAGTADGVGGLGHRAPSLNRSKSLKFQRNFNAKELLGADPSELEEEELELPIDPVTPLDEDPQECDPSSSLGGPSDGRAVRVVNGVSICEEEIGMGEHKVLAFSSGAGHLNEDGSDKVFVVPVSKQDDGTDVSEDDEGRGRDACYLDGDIDSVESLEEEEELLDDGAFNGQNLSDGEHDCSAHLGPPVIESVCEEQIAMEEVELDESDSAEPGESGESGDSAEPARAGAKKEVAEPSTGRSRGRERVRFAPAASGEERGRSRPHIRGVLKTGRSVSALPYSRVRPSGSGADDDQDLEFNSVVEEVIEDTEAKVDANGKKKLSVNFFFSPESSVRQDDGNEEGAPGFGREKSFGFAGVDRVDSDLARMGRSNSRAGGARRRARSVAAITHRNARAPAEE